MECEINRQFHSKGVLLLLDSPPAMEFGFDNISWKIGLKFKGIKLIPLGVHYMHFSLAEQKHQFKISKFLYFDDKRRIIILKWNKESQDFSKVSQQEQSSYQQGVRQLYFDCYLGPYPTQRIQIWNESSNFITKSVLGKLDPIETIANITNEYGHQANNKIQQQVIYEEFSERQQEGEEEQKVRPEVDETKVNEQKSIGKFQVVKGTVYYTDIPKKLSLDLLQTTSVNIDKTPILELLFKRQFKVDKNDFLGELQYSFVSFLLGQNLQGLQQWKKIINLISYSENALSTSYQFYMNFIVVIYNQIKQFPKDFFIDEISKDNFLVNCLKRLYEYEEIEEVNIKLRKRIRTLRTMIEKNFDFYLSLQLEQDQPTVVETFQQYF